MKDPPSRMIEDLVPGEELSGTVESLLFSNNYEKPAAFLDVGFDRPAYLDWQEASDTYPGKAFRRLKVGKPVTARVLRVQDDRIYVTCRSGDLYRPTFSEAPPQALQEIVDKFSNLPKDEYLDARVLRLFPRYAVVTVKTPDGTEAEGYIPAGYYTPSFEESGAPNDQIKVRLLPEQPKARGRRSRVMLTLKDGKKDTEEKEDASEASAKEEVAEAGREPSICMQQHQISWHIMTKNWQKRSSEFQMGQIIAMAVLFVVKKIEAFWICLTFSMAGARDITISWVGENGRAKGRGTFEGPIRLSHAMRPRSLTTDQTFRKSWHSLKCTFNRI